MAQNSQQNIPNPFRNNQGNSSNFLLQSQNPFFNFPFTPQNARFPSPNTQFPPNYFMNPYNYPQFFNAPPIMISDHDSNNRPESISTNSLGETRFENINLNQPISNP